MAVHVARMEEGRSAFKILTSTSTRTRPLVRPRCSWEDDIRKDLNEIGINTRNWVDSPQDGDYWRALVNVPLHIPSVREFNIKNQGLISKLIHTVVCSFTIIP